MHSHSSHTTVMGRLPGPTADDDTACRRTGPAARAISAVRWYYGSGLLMALMAPLLVLMGVGCMRCPGGLWDCTHHVVEHQYGLLGNGAPHTGATTTSKVIVSCLPSGHLVTAEPWMSPHPMTCMQLYESAWRRMAWRISSRPRAASMTPSMG